MTFAEMLHKVQAKFYFCVFSICVYGILMIQDFLNVEQNTVSRIFEVSCSAGKKCK